MPRGRQYYDPIVQTPASVGSTENLERIELFPLGPDTRTGDSAAIGKWVGRHIGPDGSIQDQAAGDFDHDRALQQAQELWPGLTVYELHDERQDSTWEGVGPSPRLWQVPDVQPAPASVHMHTAEEEIIGFPAPQPTEEQVALRVMPVTEPGSYVLLDDICALLEMWAVSYEVSKNPSGAMALREAVDALKEIG